MSLAAASCALALAALGAAPAAATAASGPPSQVGQWTTAPFEIKTFAINAVMLHTGKVLFWSFPPRDDSGIRPNAGRARLWDPAKGTGPDAMKDVTPPVINVNGTNTPAPFFCSGQSLLPDGRVLVTGGNFAYPANGGNPDSKGLDTAFIFDPVAETWSQQLDMDHGRWYPTQTLLPDGRTIVLSGYDESGTDHVNSELEVFTPGIGAAKGGFVHASAGDRTTDLYPHMFVIPDGEVLLAGPGDDDSALLHIDPFFWNDLASKPVDRHFGSTAVLRPMGPSGSARVTQIGGMTAKDSNGVASPLKISETIDAGALLPTWGSDAPLNIPRSYANTVLLPDSSMVEIGGANGQDPTYDSWRPFPNNEARQVEIFDPATGSWRLGPAQIENRGYHSTAVLLPDGRVFSAGDERFPNSDAADQWSRVDTAELYSPPYLFKGARPEISSAPDALHWGDDFGIGASDSAAKAVLVAPGATTHANDTNQRVVPLAVTGRADGGINAIAPPTPNVAPPGYYMLFVLDSQGVPSKASWVRLAADAPDAPVLTGDGSGGGGGSGTPGPGAGPAGTVKPAISVRLTAAALARARRSGKVSVTVRVNEPATVALTARLRRAASTSARRVLSTTVRSFSFPEPGTRPVTLRLTRAMRAALGRRRAGRLRVEARARDALGRVFSSDTTRRFRAARR